MALLLNEMGALVKEDTEEAELLNAFISSVFTTKTKPKESQSLEVKESLEKGRLSLG